MNFHNFKSSCEHKAEAIGVAVLLGMGVVGLFLYAVGVFPL